MTAAEAHPEQLVHRGRPVPWVVPWTAEWINPSDVPVQWLGDRITLGQPDVERDSLGALWQPVGNARGDGEPVWADVHIGRQRLAMRQGRCQVCAVPLDRQRTPWLFEKAEFDDLAVHTFTDTPPTCESCWPTAQRLCPHLRVNDSVPVYLVGVRRWGIRGDRFGPLGRVNRALYVPDGHSYMPTMVAKQMVVTWDRLEAAQ